MSDYKNRNKLISKKSEPVFSGVLVLTISNILVKAIGLLFKIPMNYIVGDTGMGYYNAAYSVFTFFYMLSTAGLPVAISIMVSHARGQGNFVFVRQILKTALLLFLFIGIIGSGTMFLCANKLADWIGAPPAALCILVISPSMLFVCLTGALRGYFQGCQKMLPIAISQVIEALCKMLFGVCLAVFAIRNAFRPETVAAYAVSALTIGTAFGMLYLVISKCFGRGEELSLTVPMSSNDTKILLKKFASISFPVTLSASVMSLTNMIDAVMIQRLLQLGGMTQEAATSAYGNYTSLAVPLFNLPPVFVYPIAYSIVPLIANLRASGQLNEEKSIMISSLRIATIIGLPASLGLAAFSKPILSMFYRTESAIIAAPLLTILAPSSFLICLLAITNSILQAIGKAEKPVYAMLLGCIVKICFSNLLIGKFGMMGTPISTFLCYLTVTVLNLYYVAHYTGISLPAVSLFIKPLATSGMCILAAIVCFQTAGSILPEIPAVLLAIFVAVISYIPLILRTNILTKEDLNFFPHKEKIFLYLEKCHLLVEKDSKQL